MKDFFWAVGFMVAVILYLVAPILVTIILVTVATRCSR